MVVGAAGRRQFDPQRNRLPQLHQFGRRQGDRLHPVGEPTTRTGATPKSTASRSTIASSKGDMRSAPGPTIPISANNRSTTPSRTTTRRSKTSASTATATSVLATCSASGRPISSPTAASAAAARSRTETSNTAAPTGRCGRRGRPGRLGYADGGRLYEGLYLTRGRHTFTAEVQGDGSLYADRLSLFEESVPVARADFSSETWTQRTLTVDILEDGTYALGIDGNGARIRKAAVD